MQNSKLPITWILHQFLACIRFISLKLAMILGVRTIRQVNIGLLGYGFVHSTFHMPSYREISNANVMAVAGPKAAKVQKFAKTWGIKKTYSGEDFIEKLCENPEIEVVDIGLPNFAHRKAAISAAENGKNIICEKPLAPNLKSAKDMLDAARKAGIIHCYAENQIFIPHISKVKEIISDGTIGHIFWVRSREAHFGPHSSWFKNPTLAGGGVLIDMGCHSIEVGRFLFDKKPVVAQAWGSTFVHDTKAEDNALALIQYEDGELGIAENSWTAHGGLDIRFEIHGSEGAIFIDATRETGIRIFSVASEDKMSHVVEKSETKRGWMYPVWREHEIYGYLFELKHFINQIVKGEIPRETFKDGCIVNAMIDSCYSSMASRKWEPICFQ